MILNKKMPPSIGNPFGDGFGGGGETSFAKPTNIDNEYTQKSRMNLFLKKVFIFINLI